MPSAYPAPPRHASDNCRFAAEWIRSYVGHDIGANGASSASAHASAARAFRRAFPAIAADVCERIGAWPSSEPEFRALQDTAIAAHLAGRVAP